MALRPVDFFIPSTTELKVVFSEALSESLSTDNFKVESISGNVSDLEVIGLTIDGSSAVIRTRPQISGNYYLLKLLDTQQVPFISDRNVRLVDDSVSRDLFFVGIDTVNPIRDRMFEAVPNTYEVEGLIKNVLSAQAEELYTGQRSIGELLSNNYLSVSITDEPRVRTAGAFDRLANENAYEVSRVSRRQTGDRQKTEILDYTSASATPRQSSMSVYPVSLQQAYVAEEEISVNTEGNKFDGFLLSLRNKNIIKLLSVTLIANGEVEDCDGNIGTGYGVSAYKYTIRDNFYDQDYAFELSQLENNQVLLSEFGNMARPRVLDTIVVSYLYKDLGKFVDEDSIEVYRIEQIENESIPTQSTMFFLEHAPIVDANNKVYTIGGISFAKSENLDEVPVEFQKEISFNFAILPKKPGEYSVNYETGEVFLVGASSERTGTGFNNYVASYSYRKTFKQDLDYAINNGNNLVALPDRSLSSQDAFIKFKYESVFTEGVDYEASSHIEVLNERVENKLGSSFSVKPKNTPITNVFRIVNQTTGEVYNPLRFNSNEAFFTGFRSPDIRNAEKEQAIFREVVNEELSVVGELVVPAFTVTISSNISNNSIFFSPGIPAELIDQNSDNYFFRTTSTTDGVEVEDLQIQFFGTPDGNNLINSAAINISATPPGLNSKVIVGPKAYVVNLQQTGILSKSLDSIGSVTNSSLSFEDIEVFTNEKYFAPAISNPGLSETTTGGISLALVADKGDEFYQSLSRLRKVGDYTVDYRSGVVYIAIDKDQDIFLGRTRYSYNQIQTRYSNVLNVLGAAKKRSPADEAADATVIYDRTSVQPDSVKVSDIDESFIIFDDETTAVDADGEQQLVATILEDYTIVVPQRISSISGIYQRKELIGKDLNSSVFSQRESEADSVDLFSTVANGGVNLYDPSIISFESNIIDLKKKVSKRLSISGGNFVLNINDSSAETFVRLDSVSTGQTLFDDDLNLTKVPELEIVDVTAFFGGATISILNNVSLSEVDTSADFLLDQDGNRFAITAVNQLLSTVTITTPAINNITATEPALGQATVVVKPTVTISGGVLSIIIPGDAPLVSGELVEVIYLTSSIPDIGTPMVINYRYGKIYLDYSYVYDNLVISYEYGDNAINWGISNAISEGEEYYVSYKYGALRNALRANFGQLTNIPIFQSFPTTIDRELYRNAISGTLQAFTKGPTIPAFEGLVESFTDIKPEIDELFLGGWILGRDHLYPGKIDYDGILSFGGGKFDDGLRLNDDVIVTVPAVSSLSLNDGTLEAWVRPNWAGINNDATLTFNIDHIGQEKFNFGPGEDPFDSKRNWSLILLDDESELVGGTDKTGATFTIFNYRSGLTDAGEETLVQGKFGISKADIPITRLTKFDFSTKLKIPFFATSLNGHGVDQSLIEFFDNAPTGSLAPAHVSVDDGSRVLSLRYEIRAFHNFDDGTPETISVTSVDFDYDSFPRYDGPHPTRSCKCAVADNMDTLLQFNESVIHITLSSNISLLSFKEFNNTIEDTPKIFSVADFSDQIFDVVGFIDTDGNDAIDYIPDVISGIITKRVPSNSTALTAKGSEIINDTLPMIRLVLLYKSLSPVLTSVSASKQVHDFDDRPIVFNWSEYKQYKASRDPANNIVSVVILSQQFEFLYTDLPHSADGVISTGEIIAGLSNSSTIPLGLATGGILFGSLGTASDGLLASEESDIIPADVQDTNRGISIAIRDSLLLSQVEVEFFRSTLYNRFNLTDIYIGKDGYHPPRMPFRINRDDYPKISVGLSAESDVKEGIFIGFDELCQSPMADNIGQWIFRTRAIDEAYAPISTQKIDGQIVHTYGLLKIQHTISGDITTDGEFSSVVRTTRDETTAGCTDGLVCESTFRYCANDLLENVGWNRIEETDSTLINLIIGGREVQRGFWNKHGAFTTSVSGGVYRMGPSANESNCTEEDDFLGNVVYTANPCYGGRFEHTVSLKVAQIDPNILLGSTGNLVSAVTGKYTGIVPIQIHDNELSVKLALAISNVGESLVIVLDGQNNQILDIISFEWNNGLFHEFKIEKDIDDGKVYIFIDNLLLSQNLLTEFSPATTDWCSFLSEPFIATYLFDTSLADIEIYHQDNLPNIIDVDLVYFSGRYFEGQDQLESTDIFINTDSKVEFSFISDFEVDAYDAYSSEPAEIEVGYDGYDGYVIQHVSVDEIFMSSDKFRYLFDSGESEAENRFSIFKDGKGFLNFRVYDNSISRGREVGFFNLATNIKHFLPGELHHFAASWKLNSFDERDEMHLFVDGQEAPNIYKFGGKVPVKVNDKFSDVSKEVLHNFIVKDIDFCQIFTDGITTASSSTFTSAAAGFDDAMIGRSIIVLSSVIAPTLVGKEFIINSVSGNQVTFVRGNSLIPVMFDTSANDIVFQLAPVAGLSSFVLTDVKNTKFSIYKTNCQGNRVEFGGVLYSVSNGQIEIIGGNNVEKPQFRVNVDNRIIEFIGQNTGCEFVASVDKTDLDIHIETFGLSIQRCKHIIELAGSTYDATAGTSAIKTLGAEPIDLLDVAITRILLKRQVLDIGTVTMIDGEKIASFDIDIDEDDVDNFVITRSISTEKQHLGRRISVVFDSDNVNFCNNNDGYDSYDGYATSLSYITVFGETTDGINQEKFYLTGNGSFTSDRFFKTIDRIEGSISIVDEDYFELGLIEIREADPISIQNNNGEYAEIYSYINGKFIITAFGSSGLFPFELPSGSYEIDYPAYLKTTIPMVGKKAYVGSDFNGKNQFGGIIDEFRIISEMSNDTRVTESESSGTRSVTDDYNKTIPFCADSQTLCLIPFDNPIDKQARKLRTKEYLNQEDNFKFRLTLAQREKLLQFVNDQVNFTSEMIKMGFSDDESLKTFVEVHGASGGPLYNIADFYPQYIDFVPSATSVNDRFDRSGMFVEGRSLLLRNDSNIFRNKEGAIEFWVSPLIDTIDDPSERYYLDIYSIVRHRVESKSSTVIELPTAAKSILDVKLIQNKVSNSQFFSQDETDQILFDEIYRSELIGRLTGGTGSQKDFAIGHTLSPDGTKVFLSEALPEENVDVIVSYIPIGSDGNRVSIFKTTDSRVIFRVIAGGVENVVVQSIDWKKNSWHRIMVNYRTNSSYDTMRIFIDGGEGGYITYGTGLVYGTGFVYGQLANQEGAARNVEYRIPLTDDFRLIAIGSDVYGDKSARARMDNLRFSRTQRSPIREISGGYIDSNYTANLNTAAPVIKDDITTLLLDFDSDADKIKEFATVIDPVRGIFDFTVNVIDNFDKVININDGEIEDLMVDLVNRLKPAHSNALVKFTKNRC